MTPNRADELVTMIAELARLTGKTTQETQAKKLGISDSALSKYLAAEQVPRETTLIKMLRNVDIPDREHFKYLAILNNAQNIPRLTKRHRGERTLQQSGTGQRVRRPSKRWLQWVAAGAVAMPVLVFFFVFFQNRLATTGAIASPSPDSGPAPQCSLVDMAASPVYVNIGDSKPVKFKNFNDRVRNVPMPTRTGADGVEYQAVALPDPRDSENGIGWMPKAHLKPDPKRCARTG